MAKKKISFEIVDGCQPTRSATGRTFNLRMPIPLTLPPHTVMKVRLGVSADVALFLFETKTKKDAGVRVFTSDQERLGAVDAGEELIVNVDNHSDQVLLLDHGDTICRAVPLEAVDYEFGP